MVSALPGPPLNRLNAERGKWAGEEGGVPSDSAASEPSEWRAVPPLSWGYQGGHLAAFDSGSGASPIVLFCHSVGSIWRFYGALSSLATLGRFIKVSRPSLHQQDRDCMRLVM